jgi:hypothetical protein
MIKVIVTDVQNVTGYTLDLSAIASNAKLYLTQSASLFYLSGKDASVAVNYSNKSYIRSFNDGSNIGEKGGKGWVWTNSSGYSQRASPGSGIFGFRVDQGSSNGSSNFTYGWLKTTFGTSAVTLNSYGYNSTLNETAIAGQGSVAGVPDSGPGIVGLALLGAGAAGMRLLRKLRAGN